MWAPVIIFTYNRLEHLKKCLYSLERATGAESSELYIFSDGYKGEHDKASVLAVQNYLNDYKYKSIFGKTDINCRKINRGLANSVIEGVSNIIKIYKRVIVVEDDLAVSPDFLIYMNAALEYYEKKSNIWQISGWSPQLPVFNQIKEDTYLWYRGSSWGWGSWIDRWETIDWKVRDYKSFKFSFSKRRKMNLGGVDLSDMLDRQMQGQIDSWAIRFVYTARMKEMLTVFPGKTRVINCGRDGSGTHCHDKKEDLNNDIKELMTRKESENNFIWSEQIPPSKISRQIYRYYSGSKVHCLRCEVRSLLNRIYNF